MELEFFIFLLSLAFLGYAVFLKFCYMKHKAVCLDYTRADGISLLVTCKTDHTKVVGYSEFVFNLCLGILFLISSILQTLSWVL